MAASASTIKGERIGAGVATRTTTGGPVRLLQMSRAKIMCPAISGGATAITKSPLLLVLPVPIKVLAPSQTRSAPQSKI